jgi:hypothetical protein
MSSVFKSPVILFNRVLNASDWIRYGALAVVLTGLFYVLIRQPAPSDISKTEIQPTRSRVAVLNPAIRRRSETQNPLVRSEPTKQINPVPLSPRQQVASRQGSDLKQDGRAAVCAAARAALPSFRAGRLNGRQARRLAHETYRGVGGHQSAHEAVHEALMEYSAGAWSEADCPPGPPLTKGAIGQIMGTGK